MRLKVLLAATLTLCVFASSDAEARPSLVFDARTGNVLLAYQAGDAWHPASLTKLMTVYTTFRAVRAGKISLKQKIRMTKSAAKTPPSKIGLKPGNQFSVDFAIRALMVHSANDIAVALGQAVAGSEQKFVAQMNANAKRLGMSATHFVNPHGLHNAAQVTTARDMGLLAATLIHEFPQYRAYFALKGMKVGKRRLPNRNKLIGNMKGADGMKTGFVCASGFNLVASATRNGRQLIAVVLGHKAAGPRTKFAELCSKTPSPASAATLADAAALARSRTRSGHRPICARRFARRAASLCPSRKRCPAGVSRSANTRARAWPRPCWMASYCSTIGQSAPVMSASCAFPTRATIFRPSGPCLRPRPRNCAVI